MKLAIDAMGMDKGSQIVVDAVKRFIKENDYELYVYGNETELEGLKSVERVHVLHCTQVMEMTDGALAVRRKKDSSMVRAIDDVNNGVADGIVSAGSTGALLSASTLILKTIDGIDRPALLGTLPAKNGRTVDFLDMGASSENTSDHLVQFAKMGRALAKYVKNIESPKIGLLNNGSEDKKGDLLRVETFKKLKEIEEFNFIGNVEGRDILSGEVDVVVTDGFSGNLVLKTIEGTGAFVMSTLKEKLMSSFTSKIGALLLKPALSSLKNTLDYKQYGGAILAGLNKPVVKAHGSSNAEAFYFALKQLEKAVANDVVAKIKRDLV